MANNSYDFARYIRIVKSFFHRVIHVASKKFLALPYDGPGEDQGTRPHGNGRHSYLKWLPFRVHCTSPLMLGLLPSK